MANTTWNPADLASITLSGGNLTATASGSASGTRTIATQQTGKRYWEYTINTMVGGNSGVGIANASASLTGMGPVPTNACLLYRSGSIYTNNVNTGSVGGPIISSVVSVALDMSGLLIWFRLAPSGNWNNSGTANPATGVGGLSVSSIASGAIPAYAAVAFAAVSDAVTANFGDSAFSGAVPAGFTSGFPVASTATTWDPAHKDGNLGLSNGNLTVTDTAGFGAAHSAVYATQPISPTVKQYFEVTFSASSATAQYYSVGVMNGSANISQNPGQTNGAAWVNKFGISGPNGNIYRNGTASGNYPVLVVGQVVRVAIDRTANRMWWAVNNNTWSGAAVWMGSGGTTDDPATGIGGLDISAVTGTIFPAFSAAYTNDAGVLNAGATAFAYTPPAGFVGIDSPSIPTNEILTQIAVEHWLTTSPQAQVTQVALEHWTSVASTFATPLTPAMMLSASRAGIGSVVLVQDNATRTVNIADVGVLSQTAQIVPTPPGGGAAAYAMILA